MNPNNDEFYGSTGRACPLCRGFGGWYVSDFVTDYGVEPQTPEWTRCIQCGGSGDEKKPKFPVSVSRE